MSELTAANKVLTARDKANTEKIDALNRNIGRITSTAEFYQVASEQARLEIEELAEQLAQEIEKTKEFANAATADADTKTDVQDLRLAVKGAEMKAERAEKDATNAKKQLEDQAEQHAEELEKQRGLIERAQGYEHDHVLRGIWEKKYDGERETVASLTAMLQTEKSRSKDLKERRDRLLEELQAALDRAARALEE